MELGVMLLDLFEGICARKSESDEGVMLVK
jgi:hypothetical protein